MLNLLLTCAALLAPGDVVGPDWYDASYRSALRDAAASEQLVMLVFLTEESGYSKKLVEETFTDERVLEQLGELIVFRPEPGSRRGDQLVEEFHVGSYPTIVFVRGDGGIEDAIYGFIPADPLLGELRRIKDRQGTVSFHMQAVEAAPEDLGARDALASILGNLGAHAEAQEHLDKIVELDPEGTHVVSARRAWKQRKAEVAAAAGSDDTSGWDLAPLYAHVDGAGNAEFRYEARVDLANMQLARGDYGEGFAQFELAWADAPPANARGFAFDVANFYLGSARTDDGAPLPGVADDAGAFALELALFAVEAAERQRAEGLARLEADSDGDGDGDGSDGDRASPEEQRAGWDRWLAQHHGLLARAYDAEGLPDLAAESMAAAVALDGDSEEYVELLADFRAALN